MIAAESPKAQAVLWLTNPGAAVFFWGITRWPSSPSSASVLVGLASTVLSYRQLI